MNAERWDRYLQEYASELQDAHERGEHETKIDHDCGGCVAEMRESMNREGDPAFNGAFDKW